MRGWEEFSFFFSSKKRHVSSFLRRWISFGNSTNSLSVSRHRYSSRLFQTRRTRFGSPLPVFADKRSGQAHRVLHLYGACDTRQANIPKKNNHRRQQLHFSVCKWVFFFYIFSKCRVLASVSPQSTTIEFRIILRCGRARLNTRI